MVPEKKPCFNGKTVGARRTVPLLRYRIFCYPSPVKKIDEQTALEAVIAWYKADTYRDLPWRKTADPYAIWASEVMLQQTQAPRVVSYFERFMKRFPTVESLALSTWEELLPVWRGLGFYGRGKRMIETAKAIVAHHGGKFPKDEEVLKTLPGIGPYTAAAIASFSYGAAVPAIDTNLSRVLSRTFGWELKEVEEKSRKFWSKISHPSAANHALMDIGALLCKSRKCECESCPLQSYCQFFRAGCPMETSRQGGGVSTEKRPKGKIEVVVLLIHREGKYLLGKRPENRGGEWEFPGGKVEKGETYRSAGKREAKEEIGVEVAVRPPMVSIETPEWWLRFCRSQILKGEPQPLVHEELQWVPVAELLNYRMPEPNRVVAERLQTMRV